MTADYRVGLRPARVEHDRIALPVEGSLPGWLRGTFVRNGPGTFAVGDRELAHWFDGFAMLRAYRVDGADGDNDRVEFSNRFLRSEAYRYAREHGELGYREFASDPPTSALDRLRRLRDPGFTDNATVDVDHLGGEFVATTESPRAVAFDLDSLRTRRTVGYPDDLGATDTVHPHFDFETGAHLGFATDFGRDPGYVYYRISPGEREREPLGRVSMDPPGYVHSFSLTERYAVFTVPPFVVDSPLAFLRDRPVIENFRWRPELGTRVVVLDRETGAERARYRTAPFFVFHAANAFERPVASGSGELVVDLVAFPDADVVSDFYLDNLRVDDPSLPTGELRRLRLPFDPEYGERTSGTVVTETHHRGPVAFPTINYERCNGRPYRYVWAAGNRERPPESLPNRLVKVDLRSGTTRVWQERGTFPSEAVFVPAPDDAGDSDDAASDAAAADDAAPAEDDGVLLASVLDADAERTFLLVLDAATMTELARATVPTAMPLGFHGQFYREGERPTRSMP
ncbi:carotenoid oxygenase family protein [Halobium salinum]|uniref:Carotenoid oxygenase family protein n=1 Tax=Halobium salinum TaxID=1364940 RepID=A0ABD5P9R3_9EURY|nr:carotenoid oxygenase family protein [Halobium salinum]